MTEEEVQKVREDKGVNVDDLLGISVEKVAAENPSNLSSIASSINSALDHLSDQKPPNNELIAQLIAKLEEIEKAKSALNKSEGRKAQNTLPKEGPKTEDVGNATNRGTVRPSDSAGTALGGDRGNSYEKDYYSTFGLGATQNPKEKQKETGQNGLMHGKGDNHHSTWEEKLAEQQKENKQKQNNSIPSR
jgi:hypothetical protein